jgi:hypothetical protein
MLQQILSSIFASAKPEDLPKASEAMRVVLEVADSLLLESSQASIRQIAELCSALGKLPSDMLSITRLKTHLRSGDEVMKHFAGLPFGRQLLLSIDARILELKKDTYASDKVRAILAEFETPKALGILAEKDIGKTVAT